MPKRRKIVVDDEVFDTVSAVLDEYGGTASALRWALHKGIEIYPGHQVRYFIEGETVAPPSFDSGPAEPKPKRGYSLLGYRHVTQGLGAARQP
jgi:hypothetical protein